MEITVGEKPSIRDVYRKNLEKTFNAYLKKEVKNEPERILSVGCMLGYEAGALLNTFPTAEYIGIDINEGLLKAAKLINIDQERVEFRLGDARGKEAFGNEPLDIVIIRHPQVLRGIEGRDLDNWQTIFKNSMEVLKPGGLLFVSTDSELEKSKVISYINSDQKMKIILNRNNEFPTSKETFGDRHIIISKRLAE